MKLFQVRKGQFVYFENELHKVYAVKPMYKKSIHLIRLRDLTQVLSKAAEIEKYQPKERDSFIFNKKVYTLSRERKAEVGDYVLITNPNPDILDYYTLNAIEIVSSVENKGVITNDSNGIRHNEYLLMVPGRNENSNAIEYRERPTNDDRDLTDETSIYNDLLPIIGDVYKKSNKDSELEVMVVGVNDTTVFLGNGSQVPQEELMDTEKWLFQYNLVEK
ncbi:hypothetical protein [Lysinibacillus sp. SGAir0095]|uniref:hypothetical protein n=1 Tax=Lysinibacillus sp. SGAir0095 TaxID=2070463 RepID=UPI0010CD4AE8|nr:hypothetical protein [Lysinibacillus sp. SGAir0095]QCR33819.1 hypothetical protein C1N55_17500 [Lysinibacillus sp. SGAir0095]